MAATDNRPIRYSRDLEQAATLAAECVLRGDVDMARTFAIEYAQHRDGESTLAEIKVMMATHEARASA